MHLLHRYTKEALAGQPLPKSYIIIETIIINNNKNWLLVPEQS